jgi:hypothetical protein
VQYRCLHKASLKRTPDLESELLGYFHPGVPPLLTVPSHEPAYRPGKRYWPGKTALFDAGR